MTPTTRPALPSSLTPTMAAMPEPNCFLASSIRPRRSFGATPCTTRASSFTPFSSRMRLSAAPPPLAAAKRDLALRVRQLALELAALVDDGRKPLDHFVGSDLEQLGRLAHALVLRGEIAARGIAGQRLDAADAGGDRALADDLEQADIAGAPRHACRRRARWNKRGRPARCWHRRPCETTRTSSPYFSPNSASAPLAMASSGVIRCVSTGCVLQDHGVDQILDRADLLMRHRLLMREIESEPPGLDQRALLRHMRAQHLAERLVQEMRRRMMRARRRAARMIDRRARPPRPASARRSRPRRHAGTGRAASSACPRRRSARPWRPRCVPRSPTWPPDSA